MTTDHPDNLDPTCELPSDAHPADVDTLPGLPGDDTRLADLPSTAEVDPPPSSLLESLDRRQNQVLRELERLNADIQRLVAAWQEQRQAG